MRPGRVQSGDLRITLGGDITLQFPEGASKRRDTKFGNGTATIAQKGALVTAVAAMLRYHQNRGELGTPNGSADAASLNQFLTTYCPTDAKGNADLRRIPLQSRFGRSRW